MSPDPLASNDDGTNAYSYVRNDPNNHVDPTGLEEEENLTVRTDIDCKKRDCVTLFQNTFSSSTDWEGKFVPTEFEQSLQTHSHNGYYPITRDGVFGVKGLVGWRKIDIEDGGGDGTYWSDFTRDGTLVSHGSVSHSGNTMIEGFLEGMLDPMNLVVGKLATAWLNTGIARSGVQNFVFRSIAQDGEQLAQWNLALRTVAANTESTYARTLGQRLTTIEARLAFNEVNAKFFTFRGIAGAGTHNVHHWNALSQFPELSLDPRNLFLVGSAVEDGHRVGEHIFLHWMSRSGNPYTGILRPGAIRNLGWPRSVIHPVER